jgi:hypothetical protein
MAISGWTLVLFFNFMILPKDLAIIIKCCNEKNIKFFFSLHPMRFIAYGILSYMKEMEFPIKGYGCFFCRNPTLGLTTKARACKSASQESNPGITFHAFGSVGACEGVNPHTPK